VCADRLCKARRKGYKSAIWAVVHRLCRVVWKILHEGVQFIDYGNEAAPPGYPRGLAQALRKLGYEVAITPINLATAKSGM
jgi:hypothetical protein